MKSLLELTSTKIKNQIIKGEIPYSELEKLDNFTNELVFKEVHRYDLAMWRYKIMNSLAKIVIDKSDDFWAQWEKYYDYDGMRDFREIIYIKMDKEHNLDNVSVIDLDNPYYDSYLEAYRDYMQENYNDPYEGYMEKNYNDMDGYGMEI